MWLQVWIEPAPDRWRAVAQAASMLVLFGLRHITSSSG
jgi:hypothetical protein